MSGRLKVAWGSVCLLVGVCIAAWRNDVLAAVLFLSGYMVGGIEWYRLARRPVSVLGADTPRDTK